MILFKRIEDNNIKKKWYQELPPYDETLEQSWKALPDEAELENTIVVADKLPRLIFWNVNSRTGTIPVKENELGIALVSGFSVSIAKMVMSLNIDPYKCLLEMLNSERYKPIREIACKLA